MSLAMGMLQVHLICARDLPEEASFVERTLTGSDCDPYVITKVTSGDWSDIAVTEPKVGHAFASPG